MDWKSAHIHRLVQLAIQEDQARQDVTTLTLIRPQWKIRAEIRAKQGGVIAGLPLAGLFFKALDPLCYFQALKKDGAVVVPGTPMARIEGRARALLSAERPALNALQHLSGIATFTAEQVQRLRGSRTQLLDTRKTLPGWRPLEKYAVRCGGGRNHRMSLSDAVLVKDNHIQICRLAESRWGKDLTDLKKRRPGLPIEIEIQTERDLKEALTLKPQRIMLDNMPLPRLKQMIRRIRRELPRAEIEISGGVRPEDLSQLARLKIEWISMGRLTHSAPAFDCSLDVKHVDPR